MDLKLRFSLILSVFICACVGLFSFIVYFQVKQRLYSSVELLLSSYLDHEWRHIVHEPSPHQSNTLSSAEVYHRIFKNGEITVSSFPKDVNFLVPDSEITLSKERIIKKIEHELGSDKYVLLGYHELGTTTAYLQALSRVLLLGCLVVLLVVSPMSWFLSRSLVRPFSLLSERTSELDAERLSFRFAETSQNDEYGKLVQSFNSLLDRLERSFKQVKRFASSASHEFRTPLTAILGEAEVVLRRPRDRADYEAALHSISEQAKTLKRIINHLLLLSDLERLEQVNEKKNVNVSRCIAEALESLKYLHDQSGKTVNIRGGEVTFEGNEELFSCVIGNLLENAIKYSTSHVVVGFERGERKVYLKVEDDGPGIPKTEGHDFFEPLSRVGKRQGHGLGLSIVKACIDAVKGNIEVGQSALGGLSIRVTIPEATA